MQHKRPYRRPTVFQTVDVRLERELLLGSAVDSFNEGGVYTSFQIVEHNDFESDDFNFKWE